MKSTAFCILLAIVSPVSARTVEYTWTGTIESWRDLHDILPAVDVGSPISGTFVYERDPDRMNTTTNDVANPDYFTNKLAGITPAELVEFELDGATYRLGEGPFEQSRANDNDNFVVRLATSDSPTATDWFVADYSFSIDNAAYNKMRFNFRGTDVWGNQTDYVKLLPDGVDAWDTAGGTFGFQEEPGKFVSAGFAVDTVKLVPEPSAIAMLLTGALVLGSRRRR